MSVEKNSAAATTTPSLPSVALDVPVKRGENEITEFLVRKPTSGECRGLKIPDLLQGDISTVLDLIPRITIPPMLQHEADALDPADASQFGDVIAGFFMTKRMKAAVMGTTPAN